MFMFYTNSCIMYCLQNIYILNDEYLLCKKDIAYKFYILCIKISLVYKQYHVYKIIYCHINPLPDNKILNFSKLK